MGFSDTPVCYFWLTMKCLVCIVNQIIPRICSSLNPADVELRLPDNTYWCWYWLRWWPTTTVGKHRWEIALSWSRDLREQTKKMDPSDWAHSEEACFSRITQLPACWTWFKKIRDLSKKAAVCLRAFSSWIPLRCRRLVWSQYHPPHLGRVLTSWKVN